MVYLSYAALRVEPSFMSGQSGQRSSFIELLHIPIHNMIILSRREKGLYRQYETPTNMILSYSSRSKNAYFVRLHRQTSYTRQGLFEITAGLMS